jgi:hypothetical protein
VELSFGVLVERSRVPFTFDGMRWRISGGFEQLSPMIPAGVTTVPMNLVEYAFVYDRNAVTSGNFAFQVRNPGVEEHEVVLVRLTSSTPLLELVQAAGPEDAGPPEGIEFLGFGGVFAPGEGGNVVLTQALSAGRYGLVCFIPAPDGVPHALKGMVSEFTVGTGVTTGPGAVITPPATGNAGLIDGAPAAGFGLLIAAVALLVVGAGLSLAMRR